MAHHRCTRCKQESYPRHKWMGGVYCDSCIRQIRDGIHISNRSRGRLGSLWDKIVAFTRSILHPKLLKRVERTVEQASLARLKSMEVKARRGIPINPAIQQPQKR